MAASTVTNFENRKRDSNMSGSLPEHDMLTVNEVSQLLRVDPTTTRRWIKAGILEAVSLPHANTRQAYRIKRETVEALLNKTATEVA